MSSLNTILLIFIGLFLSLKSTSARANNVNGYECDSINNSFEQISCYASTAKKLNDLTVCDKASKDGIRYQCYALFAEYSESSEICHMIPRVNKEYLSLIDICLSDVAQKVSNPDICKSISTSGLRDSCYFKLAKKLNNLTLCEKIFESGLKSGCSGKPVIVE